MKKASLFLMVILTLWLSAPVFAQETVWDMAESERYGTKVGGMLGRGILNVATCFLDVIVHTVEGTQDGPPFVGTMTGLGSGIACTALRVSSGALDVITFWVPGFNGIPVGRSYSDCLDYEAGVGGEPAEAAPSYAEPAQVSAPRAEEPQEAKKHDPYEYVKK